ncbi:MAG: sulfite exporter TauE/SafE family protein [Deltaproteobacteria bacterium]|nr:sulfite exporter TauE/SafE family protein [Deltaproteobacteria bacterium]
MTSSTETLYFVLLSTGFAVGLGHCIGMCGPIAVSLSLTLRGRNVLPAHLLYSAGRVTTYTLLGGLMGVTGSFTAVTSRIAGMQKGVMIFAGVVIVVMGLAMAGWLPGGRIFADYDGGSEVFSSVLRKSLASRSLFACLPLGLVLGLLPCGPVYTALITAARAGMEAHTTIGGAVVGGGLMFAFGLGTVPALLLVGKLADLGWLRKRRMIYSFSSFLMMAVGAYFIIRGMKY